jgi:sialate O-acetylesterase
MGQRIEIFLCMLLALPFGMMATAEQHETTSGALKLSGVFADDMVLQRDRPVRVWGWAEPGERVSVSFAGQERSVVTTVTGRWQVTLDPMPASSEARDLTVQQGSIGSQKKIISNVLVGDVWLCSGQSNMALTLAYCARKHPPLKSAMDAADNPNLRLCSIPVSWPAEPLNDVACRWQDAGVESAGSFSAIGYLFGDLIQREIDIPVGIINASRGGTWIENWLPQQLVEESSACQVYMNEYRKAMADYPEAKAGYDEFKSQFPSEQALAAENRVRKERGEKPLEMLREPRGPDSYNRPGALFNGMIAPLVPYARKGVLWYQGEGNVWDFKIYDQKIEDLIGCWRDLWGQSHLPFFMSELAPYGKASSVPEDSPRARFGEALAHVAETTGNAWVITIPDGGVQNDIHPVFKDIPAGRFAASVLVAVYGHSGICQGPVLRSWHADGSRAILKLESVGRGLEARSVTLDGYELSSDELVGFELADKNRRFFRARAEVQGADTVVVYCPEVPEPVAVRYAWASFPLCNLYNKEGFAAYPFRTDKWPWKTPQK